MFAIILNATICKIQLRASKKFGADTKEVIEIVNRFTAECKLAGVVSAIYQLEQQYIQQYNI